MTTTINLRPGTHHLKFIVDGEMRASDSLPTAVDFTNHLVNYIEISPDKTRPRKGSVKVTDNTVSSGIHPPQVVPELLGEQQGSLVEDNMSEKDEPEEIPVGDFRNIIPQYLIDLDKEEEAPAYQQGASVIGDAPTPPSLPLFLGKSILNGTTPMKDDSSVLNYPNHTVLNHLATSSIKNGVLATSVTTRYKRKVSLALVYLEQLYPCTILTDSQNSTSQRFCTNQQVTTQVNATVIGALQHFSPFVSDTSLGPEKSSCLYAKMQFFSDTRDFCRRKAVLEIPVSAGSLVGHHGTTRANSSRFGSLMICAGAHSVAAHTYTSYKCAYTCVRWI